MYVYTDHSELKYFHTKQKTNSQQAFWYLSMSEFIYHIHCRPGLKIGKPDGLSRHSGEGTSDIDAHHFNEEQLLDVENHNIGKEEDMEDMELESIDVAIWEIKNRLCVVLQEHRLKVLYLHHNNQVAEYWGRYQTQKLVARTFI